MTDGGPQRRRQRLTRDQRRDQLAAAAVEVVAAHGYQLATADAIARQAGISKGLLWHHFADREDLLEFTARRTLAIVRAAVASDIELRAPVPQVVRAALHRAVDVRRTHSTELRALGQIVVNLRDPGGNLRLGIADYEETYAGQEALFRRGQRDGDLRPDLDPRVMAVTYQGAVDSMLAYLDAHPEVDSHPYAETVADVLLHGIEQQSPRAAAAAGPGRPRLR